MAISQLSKVCCAIGGALPWKNFTLKDYMCSKYPFLNTFYQQGLLFNLQFCLKIYNIFK